MEAERNAPGYEEDFVARLEAQAQHARHGDLDRASPSAAGYRPDRVTALDVYRRLRDRLAPYKRVRRIGAPGG
jgi:hypothetical protein